MTELKDKLISKTKKAGWMTLDLVHEMRKLLLFIWIISTFTFVVIRIITPDFYSTADALGWGFATLLVQSLVLLLGYLFKK